MGHYFLDRQYSEGGGLADHLDRSGITGYFDGNTAERAISDPHYKKNP